VSEDV
jgi:hypothetical protein